MTISLDHRHSRAFYDANSVAFTAAAYPMPNLDAPGMPAAGPSFVAHAVALGDTIDEAALKKKKINPVGERLVALYRQATYSPEFALPVTLKTGDVNIVKLLPGHIWGPANRPILTYGPTRRARVMIVGKLPSKEAYSKKSAAVGAGVDVLKKAFATVGISPAVYENWYITYACKYLLPDTDVNVVPAAWMRDCAPILEQEIRATQPDYILCLGVEATKAVLNFRGNVSNLAGRAIPHKVCAADGSPRDVQVMCVVHPAYVARKPELFEDLITQITRFKSLIDDKLVTHEEIDHADIYTEETLVETVDAMIADTDPNANIIAVDCEWHGEYPTEPGAYLRTIQVSNKDRWARTIVLRHQGGQIAFHPGLDVVRRELLRLLKSTPGRHVRVGGHFLRADLPWLIDFGVDVRAEYAPAEDCEDRTHGGWDTSLMYHAVNECAKYGLDECSMKFTSAPTYWAELDRWRKKYQELNRGDGDPGGYGNVPPHILHPYAAYDADVTRRVMIHFYGTNGQDGNLAKDVNDQDCWLPYWTAHSASLAFLEMEMTGMVVDRRRADELTTQFINAQDRLLAEIRAELNWPEFNPKSQPQLAVALFGRQYASRYINTPEIPETAKLLDLPPVKTTGKRPVLWRELYRHPTPNTAVPSTDKESLGILGHINATAAKIRDYKFASQVLQSVLRKPNETDAGDFETDNSGNYVYDKGLVGCAHADGKVRTHLFQTKETGRASSARPPLQNLSSRREGDYERIIGKGKYLHPVRSVLRVPDGHVGIETDLTGAELAVLAWLAQDDNMIEHVRRNNLPESHPDHYDIHAQQAVKTFNLYDIKPTKKGFEAAGKRGMRIAAKNVNFGIPYGRGAEAIARQCKEEGFNVTAGDCQAMIEAYFESYPGTEEFLANCRARVQSPGYLVGPYGRLRRFNKSTDRAVIGEQERQAQNFPIQGGVADAVSIALNNFYSYRAAHSDIDYKIALQIHDAIVLIVPIEHAERVYKEVIPLCMIDQVPFYPRRLDGSLITDRGPYHFGVSQEVFVHWGEPLTSSQAKDLGLHFLAK